MSRGSLQNLVIVIATFKATTSITFVIVWLVTWVVMVWVPVTAWTMVSVWTVGSCWDNDINTVYLNSEPFELNHTVCNTTPIEGVTGEVEAVKKTYVWSMTFGCFV